jgi:hypothetical protein
MAGTGKSGFGANRELARIAGAKGGKRPKTMEQRLKISVSMKATLARKRQKQNEDI